MHWLSIKKIPMNWQRSLRSWVEMAGLLSTEVYPVHDQCMGSQELCSTYHTVLVVCQGPPLLQNSCTPWVPQDNGSLGHTFPRGSKATGRHLFLSIVWERGTEQGDHGKSPPHWALHLGLVYKRCLSYFTTALDKMQHHAQGCPCTSSCKDNGDREAEKFNWAC